MFQAQWGFYKPGIVIAIDNEETCLNEKTDIFFNQLIGQSSLVAVSMHPSWDYSLKITLIIYKGSALL